MHNLFKDSEIPETHQEVFKNQKVIISPHKDFEAYYECLECDGMYYIENIYLLAQMGSLYIMLVKQKEKYYLYPLWHQLRPYSYNEISKAKKGLIEPNKIGVFTDKKVNDWKNYVCEWYSRLQDLKNESTKLREKNYQILKNFCEKLGAKWYERGNEIFIDNDMFSFHYQFSEDGKFYKIKSSVSNEFKLIELYEKK